MDGDGFVAIRRLAPDAFAGQAHGAEPEAEDREVAAEFESSAFEGW